MKAGLIFLPLIRIIVYSTFDSMSFVLINLILLSKILSTFATDLAGVLHHFCPTFNLT